MKISIKFLLKIMLLLPSLVIAGPVQEAELSSLQGCRYIMDFKSSATSSSIRGGYDLHAAKKEIMKMAGLMGATHVAWVSQRSAGTQITGKAYEC